MWCGFYLARESNVSPLASSAISKFSRRQPFNLCTWGFPVKDKRPVNLDIGTIRLPITAYVSILHRISGVALIAAVAVVLGLLGCSLRSEESFANVQSLLASVPMKLLMWLVLSAFVYHICAGVKHLIMDMGIGETLEGGRTGAKLALVFAAIGIIAAGIFVW